MPENGETEEPQGPQEGQEQPPVGGRAAGEGGERRGNFARRFFENLRRRRENPNDPSAEEPAEAGATSGARVAPEGTLEERLAVDELALSSLMRLARQRRESSPDFNAGEWDDSVNHLNGRIAEVQNLAANNKYREVFEFTKLIKNWVSIAQVDPKGKDDLASFLSDSQVKTLEDSVRSVDIHFGEIYANMEDDTREIVFGELESDLQHGIDAMRLGNTVEDLKTLIFRQVRDRATGELIPGSVERNRNKEPAIAEGILEWRATNEIDGVEKGIAIKLLTEPPARWQEVPERLANIYKYIESTDFTVEQLSNSIQQAVQMIQTVERNHPEGRQLLAQLNKELKAFQAFHMFRVTMEREHQDPDAAQGVFKNYFDDDTWKSFAERFSKDNRGREFVRVERQPEGSQEEYVEKEKLNVFEVAKKIYFERLQRERQEMNLVEALTAMGIENEIGSREMGIAEIVLTNGERQLSGEERAKMKTKLEELRKTFLNGKEVPKWNLRTGEILKDDDGNPITELKYKFADPKKWGKIYDDDGNVLHDTRLAVREWYKNETLLGAGDMLNVRRGEMRGELAKRLADLGVKGTDGKVRPVDPKELMNSGYLESVDYNAYNFVWTMAWSDFDIIRVYGKEAAGKINPMISQVVYNERSSLYTGRIIDHPWEFLAEEQRGRPGKQYEVNQVMRKMFPGRHHGLFERNRTMVRAFDYFTTPEERKRLRIEERVQELMKRHDFSHPDPLERDWFRSWAEGIVKGEIIDNGEVNFGDVDFSKEAIPSAQYWMSDLYSDRGFTVKYLNKENFQGYLADPTTANFRKINRKATAYYSGRNIRLWPWMTLATRAHWEFNSKHARKLFQRDNMTAASGEKLIDDLVDDGDMEKKQGTHEKRRNFGFYYIGGRIKIGEWVISEKEHKLILGEFFGMQAFRKTRQTLERLRRMGWDARWLWIFMLLAGAGEGLKTFGKELPRHIRET